MDVTRCYTKIYVIKMCQIDIGVYIKYTSILLFDYIFTFLTEM